MSNVQTETVVNLRLTELFPFPGHPFKVRDDETMSKTAESIKEYGVLVPIIVRPRSAGGYEIISGHRRKRACEMAGIDEIPAFVREVDADTATIMMVDSNIQRENVLPSEKAAAYKMKMEAIKRRAGRPKTEDLVTEGNCGQLGHNFRGERSRDIVAEGADESARQVQRYIRLTELSPDLQQMVDDKKIALTSAVELSYLKPSEQEMLEEAINDEQKVPSLAQAQRIRNISKDKTLTKERIVDIMRDAENIPKPPKGQRARDQPKEPQPIPLRDAAPEKPPMEHIESSVTTETLKPQPDKNTIADFIKDLKTEKEVRYTPRTFKIELSTFLRQFIRQRAWYISEIYLPAFDEFSDEDMAEVEQLVNEVISSLYEITDTIKNRRKKVE